MASYSTVSSRPVDSKSYTTPSKTTPFNVSVHRLIQNAMRFNGLTHGNGPPFAFTSAELHNVELTTLSQHAVALKSICTLPLAVFRRPQLHCNRAYWLPRKNGSSCAGQENSWARQEGQHYEGTLIDPRAKTARTTVGAKSGHSASYNVGARSSFDSEVRYQADRMDASEACLPWAIARSIHSLRT